MTRPWLTVAMTTFNASDYLSVALDSIISQGDAGVEVVAVDDASTDETLNILDTYRSRLDLRVVVHDSNTANWMAGLNIGLQMARGDYACFLQHDDYWLPGRLRELRSVLESDPCLTLLLHPAQYVDCSGAPLGIWRCPLRSGVRLAPESVAERLLIQNFVAVPAALFRTDAARAVGGLDETLWYAADWDFWIKLSLAGGTAYLARPLSAYRIHNHSMTWWRTREQVAEQRRQMELVLDRHIRSLAEYVSLSPSVRKVAEFSIEVNSRLAAGVHGEPVPAADLVRRYMSLGPSGWHRFLRDSRIAERVVARLRAGMHRWRHARTLEVAGSEAPRG